jgi:hypothetical protein
MIILQAATIPPLNRETHISVAVTEEQNDSTAVAGL